MFGGYGAARDVRSLLGFRYFVSRQNRCGSRF
jgi:hypothetical protein